MLLQTLLTVLAPATSGLHHSYVGKRTGDNGTTSDFPCPEHAAIAPCRCAYDGRQHLDLDCSDVIGDLQLQQVFQAHFPTKEYRKLTIASNPYIRALHDILNNVTFSDVTLDTPNLEMMSQYFLFDSIDRLESLVIESSDLTKDTFPFTSLPFYENLKTLVIENTSFPEMPKIYSDSLTELELNSNNIEHIDEDAFINAPMLEKINLDKNQLRILPKNMMELDLTSTSSYDEEIYDITFEGNGIEYIAPHAFKLQTSSSYRYTPVKLNFKNNRLTILEEKVFKDILYYGSSSSTINVDGNPLRCDCTLAWIFEQGYNSYDPYLNQLSPAATCADGKLLTDLRESDFSVC